MVRKDIEVDIPKRAKKQGEYIYIATSSESRNRGDRWVTIENRTCIGRISENGKMNPNEKYFQLFSLHLPVPSRSDTLKVGSTIVFAKIASELGIRQILSDIIGDKNTAFVLDLCSYFITGKTGVMQHYHPFMRDRLTLMERVPYDSEISEFFKDIICESTMLKFQEQWVRKSMHGKAIALSYDSTNYNSAMSDSEYAEYGKAKLDEGLPQVNLSYVVDMDTSLPLFYERYYGSINDMSEFQAMAKRANAYGIKDISLIMDRGYFGQPNISICDAMGYSFIILAKTNSVMLRGIIYDHLEEIRDNQGFYIPSHHVEGMSIKGAVFSDKKERFIHIYYDSARAEAEREVQKRTIASLQSELERKKREKREIDSISRYSKCFSISLNKKTRTIKDFELKSEEIQRMRKEVGFFSIITSKEMSAEDALTYYRSRNSIEVMFKQLKTFMGLEKARVHSELAADGKYGVAFIASIIRAEFERRTKPLIEKIKSNDSVNTLIAELDKITCTTGYNSDLYIRRYALTAKQKSILNLFDISENELDRTIEKLASKR